MNASVFDPALFLNASVEGQMETRFEPLPPGTYHGVIKSVEARQTQKGQTILDITWTLDDPALAQKLNRAELNVRQGVFLDINQSTGALELGPNKNIGLGRLRAALGQNQTGAAWSPRQLFGAGPCNIEVENEPNKDDPTIIYERVSRVSALS